MFAGPVEWVINPERAASPPRRVLISQDVKNRHARPIRERGGQGRLVVPGGPSGARGGDG